MANKYGIAIDYRRCIGCGSCSVSCKLENNLPNDVWYCTDRKSTRLNSSHI